MTPAEIELLKKKYSRIAKEEVYVNFAKGMIYTFGEELACLRLHYKIPGKVKFSKLFDSFVHITKA